ncbi:signal peptidase II [uncultured Veillonella sp.]|uniref:signal peptidase II n=1 Tax=uncultured Veillonella sp. TaxID=159268 RepID=UPI0025FAB987|nr:signal peptidase II [uncultured Veillonella sp.]MDY3974788.1 signal peptidase II [Veillonella caviae]
MTFYVIMGLVWLALDQATKIYVQDTMYLGESIPVIPNVFHFTYILNKGAAFGILEDQRIFFLLIVAILLGVLFYLRKYIYNGSKALKVGTSLLVSGALGNGWDRYHLGAVVDFFDFRIWPIFNVADIGICLGVAALIYHVWRQPEKGDK